MKPLNILLIEPGYPNKYPPLGLMKLAAHHGPHGTQDSVTFVKGTPPWVLLHHWDRVYVTTLFSFEWNRTAAAIDLAVSAAKDTRKVFVGGIAASLMHAEYAQIERWQGVRFIKGLLADAPADALRLDPDTEPVHPSEHHATPVEEQIPDYSILEQLQHPYPVHDAYFGYASRGCIRKCSFCGVPALEGPQRETPPLAQLVEGVAHRHGEKKDLVLMDNNITAAPNYREVIAQIRDLGFQRDATLSRGQRRPVKRRLDFNQGVDARILAKSPVFLKELATTCISPLRIAFDHTGLRKPYEKAVRTAADHAITNLSNYMLYNFLDSPADLYQRMNLNILLNEELGIRIWSFPMRYQPVNLKDRSHVGPKWTRYQLRSFQLILQATRGVVSGNPSFFNLAFGASQQEFEYLLTIPHAFIFHRTHFWDGPGRPEMDEYNSLRSRMSNAQTQELLQLLSGHPQAKHLDEANFPKLANDRTIDPLIRKAIAFHCQNTKKRPRIPVPATAKTFQLELNPPPDQAVEDAGLFE